MTPTRFFLIGVLCWLIAIALSGCEARPCNVAVMKAYHRGVVCE